MSLESVIEENTKAILALKATMGGNKAPAAAAASGKPAAGRPAKPKHDLAAITERAVEVKAKFGSERTSEIIGEAGGAPKLKEVKTDMYDKLMKAFDEALAADPDDEDGDL
jgi:hypothetical protein